MCNGLCSVIMPAYNAERYIREAIESVLAQTYENFELIVVNDCSNDGTADIIAEYSRSDSRIRVFSQKKNYGCAAARNLAIEKSRGRYLAFIDSDDIWAGNKLAVQISRLESGHADLVYTSYEMVDSRGEAIKTRRLPPRTTLDMLLKENYICFSSVLLYSRTAKKYKMHSVFFHEDYCFLLELLKDALVFSGEEQMLVKYRLSGQNRSRNKLNASRYRWRIYREFMGIRFWASVKYFLYYWLNGVRKYYL